MGSTDRRSRRDVTLSSVIGPINVIITVGSFLILYPTIIRVSGLEVLGLWSLIAAFQRYMNVIDIGFTALFIRTIGRGNFNRSQIVNDKIAASRFYFIIMVVVLVVWLVISDHLECFIIDVIAGDTLKWCLVVQIIATYIGLSAQLGSACLMGLHRTYQVQAVDATRPLIHYSIAILGAYYNRPIEGLVVGTFSGRVYQYIAYMVLLKRTELKEAGEVIGRQKLRKTARILGRLIAEGKHFYAISLGFVLREPIYKFVISGAIGLWAVGVYEIANRIPSTIRSFLFVGSRALFPALAYHHGNASKKVLIRYVGQIERVIVGVGCSALLVYMVLADDILLLWLGGEGGLIVLPSRIITLFWMITVFNIPYWYILQANGNEKTAATSLWLHTGSLLLLIPFASIYHFSINEMLSYWVVTSIMTQIAIYYKAHKTERIVLPTLITPRVLLVIACIGLMLASGYFFSDYALKGEIGSIKRTIYALLLYTLLFLVLVLPSIWSSVRGIIFVDKRRELSR